MVLPLLKELLLTYDSVRDLSSSEYRFLPVLSSKTVSGGTGPSLYLPQNYGTCCCVLPPFVLLCFPLCVL